MSDLPKNVSQLTLEQRKEMEEKLKNMSPEELKELQKKQCVFCQIISDKIPSKKVYEDDRCIAILDINPATKGHLLILPKEHYTIMPQVSEKEIAHLFLVSKHLSKMILKGLKVDGTNLFIANGPVAGQKAQHLMVHLIPRKNGDGVLSIKEKLIDEGMVNKIKGAVEEKILEVLGGERILEEKESFDDFGVVEKKKEENEILLNQKEEKKKKKKEPEKFITSLTAKRYHKEKCVFAQNIPEGRKVILKEDNLLDSGKKPCTCVTGKKIPLKKEEDKKGKEDFANVDELKKKSSKQKKDSESPEKKESIEEKEDGVSLDDIANLFT